MTKQVPPDEVADLFLPRQQPAFKLLRQVGSCRLWRSQTVARELYSGVRRSQVDFHVTTGQEVDYVWMPRFKTAMLNFELAVRQAAQ